MDVEDRVLKARSISLTDVCRITFLLASMAAVGVVGWFVVPFVQALLIPSSVAGRDGPWIVRAGPLMQLMAAAAVSVGVHVFLLPGYKRRWVEHDRRLGTYFPNHGLHGESGSVGVAKIRVWIRDGLTVLVLCIGVSFYFFQWTRVSADGFESHGLLRTSRFTFDQVKALHDIPEGASVDNKRAEYSSYIIRFRNDDSITLEPGSRVLAEPEFKDLLDYIVKRTGKTWEYDPRVR